MYEKSYNFNRKNNYNEKKIKFYTVNLQRNL